MPADYTWQFKDNNISSLVVESDLFHIEHLALSHGQARGVLDSLGLHAGGDAQTFDSYIKSLRRDGVPFGRDELGVGPGHNLKYRYPHMMELAVALALRTQGILSRDIVGLLAFHRTLLRSHYRRAWLERECGLGASKKVVIDGTTERRISGTYLTLGITYNSSGYLRMIEPQLIDPAEAFDHYMGLHRQVYPRPPLPISQIAEDIVRLAEGAPEIKRGRRSWVGAIWR
jgi:hypothetical protein